MAALSLLLHRFGSFELQGLLLQDQERVRFSHIGELVSPVFVHSSLVQVETCTLPRWPLRKSEPVESYLYSSFSKTRAENTGEGKIGTAPPGV